LTDKEAQWAKVKMEDYRKNAAIKGGMELTEKEFEEVMKADKIYKAVFHPDTKEKVPYPFRMCSFVPVNLPIVFGMVCTKSTIVNVIFWQWINQTYNACWNYSNRNASSPFTKKELGIAYGGAVSSSIGVALFGRWMGQKFGITSGSISKMRFVNGLVALFALSTAGFLNLYLIRYNEMIKGIKATYKGKEYGVSKIAAKRAVITSGLTRSALPVPLLMITPICWKLIEVMKIAPKGKVGIIGADMFFLIIALTLSLPLAVSLFSQDMIIEKDKLEPEFRNLKDTEGKPITHFVINKGL
jgi:sideroflexin-5